MFHIIKISDISIEVMLSIVNNILLNVDNKIFILYLYVYTLNLYIRTYIYLHI